MRNLVVIFITALICGLVIACNQNSTPADPNAPTPTPNPTVTETFFTPPARI